MFENKKSIKDFLSQKSCDVTADLTNALSLALGMGVLVGQTEGN
ncbi:hypothetical protein ACFL0X_00695 [Nanoarchaeota archaeon]